jgi:hypothetical protein
MLGGLGLKSSGTEACIGVLAGLEDCSLRLVMLGLRLVITFSRVAWFCDLPTRGENYQQCQKQTHTGQHNTT